MSITLENLGNYFHQKKLIKIEELKNELDIEHQFKRDIDLNASIVIKL